MRYRTGPLLAASLAVLLGAGATPVWADELADVFKGRTVSLQVGFGPGGANDVWARTIARHLGRYWPGSPTVVVQNQAGAGGLTLMNQLYAVAPKDGSVIGIVSRGIPLEPLLGGQGTQFDAQRMTWVGSPDRDITVCAARKDAPVQSMGDLFKTELVVGATGSGADTAIYPEFLTALLGMRFKTVKGYKGSNDIILAMERGEVQGICVAYDSLQRQPIAKEGRVNVLFQAAMAADPKLGKIPVGIELARNEGERQALQLFFARVALGRPFVAPPGLPANRVQMIRKAFMATLADAELVSEAAKQGLTVDAISGEELGRLIALAYATPKDVVERTAKALGR